MLMMTDPDRSAPAPLDAGLPEPNGETRPWEQLEAALDAGDPEALDTLLDLLSVGEAARGVSRLDESLQNRLFSLLSPEQGAALIEELSLAQAADLFERMPPEQAGAIMSELASDDRVDMLAELGDDDAEAILARMDPDDAADARRLGQYDPETAGGLMISEFLAYDDEMTVRDVLDDLRANAEQYADYDVQYAFIVSARPGKAGRLVGVLQLRDLLLAPGGRRVVEIMLPEPLSVDVHDSLDALEEFFDRHHFFGVPVVDDHGRLVGVVRRVDVEEALAGRADRDTLKMQGIIGGEELRTMPLATRVKRRLSWLSANIVLNIVAVSVIAYYQETIAMVTALAVFLPLISDMGGNAGVQSIAVSIRELSLGLIRPHELMWVIGKEVSLGIANGIVLGILVGLAGWAWQGNAMLGVVVGVAMMLNTIVAAVAGGITPLVMKRWNMDPALASGPILTTITDMTGFFFVLSFATLVLPMLADTA